MTKTISWKRGVTVVTPGVSLNDEVLQSKETNNFFLASVYFANRNIGISFWMFLPEFLTAQGNAGILTSTSGDFSQLSSGSKIIKAILKRLFGEDFHNFI